MHLQGIVIVAKKLNRTFVAFKTCYDSHGGKDDMFCIMWIGDVAAIAHGAKINEFLPIRVQQVSECLQ